MSFYLDTSVLVPLLFEEARSAAVERFVGGVPAGSLVISHWTRMEFSSVLAREARMGGLAPEAARAAEGQFAAMVRASFVVLPVSAADYDLGIAFLGTYEMRLRLGDALHLAIARNNRVDAVYSLDKSMCRAGGLLGFAMPDVPGVHG